MEKRTRSAGTKLTEGEYERLERAAQARGLKLGEWVREVLLEAAEPEGYRLSEAAPAQREGVRASLNLIADSLALLKRADEATSSWTAREWALKRRGWIFLTSTPELRAPLQLLISLWLDLLVLRLMTQPKAGARGVWFVLDELASLQKLPQLATALTENRKSENPLVVGLQGKAQLETIYGHEAEAMLSQPRVQAPRRKMHSAFRFLELNGPHPRVAFLPGTAPEFEAERWRVAKVVENTGRSDSGAAPEPQAPAA